MKTEVQRINSSGLANGWHAQALQKDAHRMGKSMSDIFQERVANSFGYSVPATCVRVSSVWTDYVFLDGSKLSVRNFD